MFSNKIEYEKNKNTANPKKSNTVIRENVTLQDNSHLNNLKNGLEPPTINKGELENLEEQINSTSLDIPFLKNVLKFVTDLKNGVYNTNVLLLMTTYSNCLTRGKKLIDKLENSTGNISLLIYIKQILEKFQSIFSGTLNSLGENVETTLDNEINLSSKFDDVLPSGKLLEFKQPNRYAYPKDYNKKLKFLKVEDWPLFPWKPCKEDIKQNKLGNCSLLAALSSIVDKNPDAIENMLVDNGDGTVTGRLYCNGPKFYKVQKSLPVDKDDNLIYSNSYVIWPEMINKVIAVSNLIPKTIRDFNKRFQTMNLKEKNLKSNSYNMLESNDPRIIFSLFFDEPLLDYEEIKANINLPKDSGGTQYSEYELNLYNKLKEMLKNNTYITTWSSNDSSESKNKGLVMSHAYAILNVKEYGGYKFVTIRNPWGFYTRQYEIGKKNELISKENNTINSQDSSYSNGISDVELKDFMKFFTYISYANNQHKDKSKNIIKKYYVLHELSTLKSKKSVDDAEKSIKAYIDENMEKILILLDNSIDMEELQDFLLDKILEKNSIEYNLKIENPQLYKKLNVYLISKTMVEYIYYYLKGEFSFDNKVTVKIISEMCKTNNTFNILLSELNFQIQKLNKSDTLEEYKKNLEIIDNCFKKKIFNIVQKYLLSKEK